MANNQLYQKVGFINVTNFSMPKTKKEVVLTPNQKKVLAAIEKGETIGHRIAKKTKLAESSTYNAMKALIAKGLVSKKLLK